MADTPPTLLDTIKQNQAAMTTPGSQVAQKAGIAPTTGEQTEQVQALAATASTGKAAPIGGVTPRLSAVGEKLASMNTLMQTQQVAQAGGLQNMAQQQQQEYAQQQQQQSLGQISQQRIDMQSQFNEKIKGMMADQSENLSKLDLSKSKARVEQMGFMLRLGNEQYIDKLNTEATKAHLDNSANFNEALSRSVFADDEQMMASSLEFRTMIQGDERSTLQTLSNIDLDFAMQLATTQAKGAAGAGMWSGVGGVVSAGAGAAAKFGSKGTMTDTTSGEGTDVGVPADQLSNAGYQGPTGGAPDYSSPGFEDQGTGTVAPGPAPFTPGVGPTAPPGG